MGRFKNDQFPSKTVYIFRLIINILFFLMAAEHEHNEEINYLIELSFDSEHWLLDQLTGG